MGRSLAIIGGVFTTAYLIGLSLLIGGRWQDLKLLTLNNLGDFVAGAFGPLAIIWLVLGYFQQGIELRQNSQALHLQAQELANSVEQQRELVKVAQDQYKADREAMEHQMKVFAQEQERLRIASLPKFVLTGAGGSHSDMSTHSFNIANLGAPCTELRIKSEDGDPTFTPDRFPWLKDGDAVKFSCLLPRTPPFQEKRVHLIFTDSRGLPGKTDFWLRFTKGDTFWTAKLEEAG